MKKKAVHDGEKRMLGIEELCAYLGTGISLAKKFASECGAEKKIGRRTVYDKVVIDKALDEMG